MFYDQLFTRAQCNYCQQEIPGMGIECCECTITPHVRLCAECFSLGAEMGPHKADHRYRFFDSGSVLIFPPQNNKESSSTDANPEAVSSWSARADIRLLDAIEQYGFGNWQDISKHVECKSSSEAKDEYVNRFVTGTTGQATWHTFPYNSEIDSTDSMQTQATIVQRPIDHTRESDDSPLSPSLTSKLPPLDISSDEMQQLGYMADRDDYEKEYDNDAEKLVSQLTFNPEDDDAEIGLKLSLVDMYSRRLRERVRRKRVIRDYQLVSLFFKKDRTNISKDNGALTRKRFAAYEKELTERLRHLSPFHTAREHENFVRNFTKEKELKFRIQELYKYRKNGITREEECIEYERHKLSLMRRNKMLSNQSKPNSPDNVCSSSSRSIPSTIPEEGVLTSLDQGSSHASHLGDLPIDVPQLPLITEGTMMGMEMGMDLTESMMETSVISDLLLEKDDVNDALCYPGKSPILQQSFTDDFSLNFEELPSDLLLLPVIGKQPKTQETMPQLSIPLPILIPENEPVSLNSSPPVEKPKDTEDQSTVNICLLPSSLLLSTFEQNLCLRLNLLPSQYMTIKAALLMGPLENCSRPANIDASDWERIISFMTNNGWMPVAMSYSDSPYVSPNHKESTEKNINLNLGDLDLDLGKDFEIIDMKDHILPLTTPLFVETEIE